MLSGLERGDGQPDQGGPHLVHSLQRNLPVSHPTRCVLSRLWDCPHSLNSLYTCDPMWCRIQRCRLGSKVKNKKYYFQWWSLCSTPKYSSISRYKQTKYTCIDKKYMCIDKIHICKLLCVKIVMVLVSMTSCASKWKIKRNYVLIWWRLGDFCGIPLLCCTFIIYKN